MADTGYFLMADVLGFGKIIDNSTALERDTRIYDWVSLVESIAEEFGIEQFQLISDTLFASVASDRSALIKLLDFSSRLLTDGIEKSFPIRGAIVHGEFTWGKLTYGPAVIDAHRLEQAQNWIGITCAVELPGLDELWSVDRVVCYSPPLKHGLIKGHPVVSWSIPIFDQLVQRATAGGLTQKGEKLTWDWGEKINNTVLFQLYQQRLHKNKESPARFHGRLPVEPISAALGNT